MRVISHPKVQIIDSANHLIYCLIIYLYKLACVFSVHASTCRFPICVNWKSLSLRDLIRQIFFYIKNVLINHIIVINCISLLCHRDRFLRSKEKCLHAVFRKSQEFYFYFSYIIIYSCICCILSVIENKKNYENNILLLAFHTIYFINEWFFYRY